jgi:cohesin loading factor subunit SCC2
LIYFKNTLKPKHPVESQSKSWVVRLLYTLGLISKYFDIEASDYAEFNLNKNEDIFKLIVYFMKNFDFEVQLKALQGLGSFFCRYSEYMMRDDVKQVYLYFIKSQNLPHQIKNQVFQNLTDYLSEEDHRNMVKSSELAKTHDFKDDLKEMMDVQSGMASSIIQSYLKPILESYLTSNSNLRVNIFNCLSMVLTQGLVYPIECVPHLIAMTTDVDKKIQTKALSHLTNLFKAHPGIVQSKSIAGVKLSFLLHRVLHQDDVSALTTNTNDTNSAYADVVRGFSEHTELLSLNHHLYSLLRVNRSYRRAFVQQLLKMFDDTSIVSNTNQSISLLNSSLLAQMLYITDNLAYFPYQTYDEPLYLIHQIDLIISVTGINLLQSFKEVSFKYSSVFIGISVLSQV